MKSDLNEEKPHFPWNKGRLVGQKTPLKLREIWGIRIRLQQAEKVLDLALFNLAIDSKLRGCDLVNLRVCDISQGKSVCSRAYRYAAQDASASTVRSYRTDTTVGGCLDRCGGARFRQLSISKQGSQVAASFYAPVRTHRCGLDRIDRFRPYGVWHAHHAPNKGHADLPANEEPSGSPTPSWAYQVRKHGAIPRHRSRRRAGNRRADRKVKFAYNRTVHLSGLSLSSQERAVHRSGNF